jgi:hypothetical protein
VTLVTIIERPDALSTGYELVILHSSSRGRTWSRPEPIWTMSTMSFPSQLRLHVTSGGDRHVIWRDQDGRHYHVWQRAGGEWDVVHPPRLPEPVILGSFSGVDRCGRVTLIVNTLVPPGVRSFYSSSWEDGRWSVFKRLRHENPAFAFDGLGHDNNWYVGWVEPQFPITALGGVRFRAMAMHP